MYTFLVTYRDMDGGDDQKLSIGVDMCCIDNEDLKGMDPDQYAWIRAVKSASFILKRASRLSIYLLDQSNLSVVSRRRV